jgi:hypothetical protein
LSRALVLGFELRGFSKTIYLSGYDVSVTSLRRRVCIFKRFDVLPEFMKTMLPRELIPSAWLHFHPPVGTRLTADDIWKTER